MKVLIVGAGAVGQVFGLGLIRSGVELGFFDRPETLHSLQEESKRGGIQVCQIVGRGKDRVQNLEGVRFFEDVPEVKNFAPEQVWFAVPSQVYHSDWFGEFLRAIEPRIIVCFAPEGDRPEFHPAGVERDRMVFGGVTFMGWKGDLGGGGGRPGMVNFVRPSFPGITLSGSKGSCAEVGSLLKASGIRVNIGRPGSRMQACVTSLMTVFMAGLELAGWKLKDFRKSPWLRQSADAGRQAFLSQIPQSTVLDRWVARLISSPAVFWVVASLLPGMTPFDIESYIQFHYTKTRAQTLELLEMYVKDGKMQGKPVDKIMMLIEKMSEGD